MASTSSCMSTLGTMQVCMYRSASTQPSGVWGSFILGSVVTGAEDGAETGSVVGRSVADGSVADGSVAGGSVAGGSVAGGSVAGGSVAGGSVAGGSVAGGSVAGGSVAGCSGIASVAGDVLGDGLVASTIGIWTEVSLQVALVRKWVSRRLNLPPHLVHTSFCFLVAFLERVFCDRRWSYSLPCLSGQYLR